MSRVITHKTWWAPCNSTYGAANIDPAAPRRAVATKATMTCLGFIFFLGWMGGPGKGRALGAGDVKFSGQVLPTNKKVTYRINLKRVIMRKLFMGIADATMEVDGRVIYEAKNLRVGLFTSTEDF